MSRIKLRRGSGSPAGSLEQYEVAMDVADRTLYTSTDGSDAVVLANNTEHFLANNTISGLTNESANYNNMVFSNRVNNTANQPITSFEAQRDLGSSTLDTGLDDRGAGYAFAIKQDSLSYPIYPGVFFGKSGGAGQTAGVENTVGMSVYSGPNDSPAYSEIELVVGNRNQVEVKPRLKALDGADIEDPDAELDDAVVNIKVDQSGYNRAQIMCEDSNGKAFSIIGEMDDVNQNRDKFIVTLDPDNLHSPTNQANYAGDYGVYYLKEYGDIENPAIEMNVFGAKDAFKLRIYDDNNGASPNPGPLGSPGYGFKPMEVHCDTFAVMAKDSDTSTDKVLEVDSTEAIFEVPIRNAQLSADPANPENGWQYYNTTTHKLRLYANGAWVDLN